MADTSKEATDPSGRRSTELLAIVENAVPRRWIGPLVVTAATIYLLFFAFHGWIHHDEGLLAHTAERVLQGELPHRDFDDTYTGGLALLHALAFKIFGVKLSSIRIVLLAFSVAFTATIYALAVRILRPLLAALVTVTCVVWSLPNYFAALPSWYNLFFATFGAWTLCRFLDSRRAGWLAAAGIFGGLSLVTKIVGAYYVAAVLLFLVDYERRSSAASEESRRSIGYGLFVTLCLALFVAGLAGLTMPQWSPMVILLYVVPGAILALYLGVREWQAGRGPSLVRFKALFKLVLPFGVGLVLPVMVLMIPYLASGTVDALYRGVFVTPRLRLTEVVLPPPQIASALMALPYAALLIYPLYRRVRAEPVMYLVVGGMLLTLFLQVGNNSSYYRLVWYSVRPLTAVVAVATVLLLLREDRAERLSVNTRSQIVLFSALAAMLSLVQFPAAHVIYFCFAAPLLILAIAQLVSVQPWAPKRAHLCVLGFYLLFGAYWLNSNWLNVANYMYRHMEQNSPLPGDRAGICVNDEDQVIYTALLREIEDHSAAGSYIYAGPDCPEVYFLSARRNPTRNMYELFGDAPDRTRQILDAIDRHDITVVVINRFPEFSPVISKALAAEIKSRFPHGMELGRFAVFWREPPQDGHP
jgi:Dolichyl-phosphate-mannose-protein mannosyltransferase